MSISSSAIDSIIASEDVASIAGSEREEFFKPINLNEGSGKRISACLITLFPPKADKKYINPQSFFGSAWNTYINVWVAQFEKCPETDRLHCHIYTEFVHERRFRFNQLLKVINPVCKDNDIQVPRGRSKKQRQGAVNYCQKEYTRVGPAPSFKWAIPEINIAYDSEFADTRVKKKSKKDGIKKEIIAHIMSKPVWWTYSQIMMENEVSQLLLCDVSWAKKFHDARKANEPRRIIENVIICYGVGGSGKTTFAANYDEVADEPRHARYYKRNYDDGNFWGGGNMAYNGQRIIHLDEYAGQEKISEFNEICELGHQGKPVNVKNSGGFLNHSTVIVTSNIHPAFWYQNAIRKNESLWNPFWRRVTKLLFFPQFRADETLNRAGEVDQDGLLIPAYFVDQTNEWKSECNHFSQAIKHGERIWPKKESEEGTWSYSNRENNWLYNGQLPRVDSPNPPSSRVVGRGLF